MRKLRPAEWKFLEFMKEHRWANDRREWPKGTNHRTVQNLREMGFIRWHFIAPFFEMYAMPEWCPLVLTEKGEKKEKNDE